MNDHTYDSQIEILEPGLICLIEKLKERYQDYRVMLQYAFEYVKIEVLIGKDALRYGKGHHPAHKSKKVKEFL